MDADAPSQPPLGVTAHPAPGLWLPVAVLLATLAIAHGLWVLLHAASPLPYQDQWEFLTQLRDDDGSLGWQALWAPHNEHRIIVPRLLLLADVWLDGARSTSVIALHVLLLAAFALALGSWAGLDGKWRAALTALCLGLLLSAADIVPLLEPFSISFSLVLIGVACAVWAAESGRMLAALCCALLATLSSANGLLVWPLLLLFGLVRGYGRTALVALLLAGVALTTAYLWHHPLWDREGGGMLVALASPFAMLRFVALFLAGPVGQVNGELGRVWGVLLMLATAILALRFWRATRLHQPWPRGRVVLLALALFLVGCALAAAVTRLDTTPRPPRYSAMAITFTLCLVGLWAGETQPILRALTPQRLALAIAVMTVGATALYAPRQAGEAAERHARLAAASAVLRDDLRTEAALQSLAAIAPDPLRPLQLRPFLVAHRLTIFADAP